MSDASIPEGTESTSTPETPKAPEMKNKLTDLNNHLFAQLERLGDEDLTHEQIETEAARADAIVSISDSILRNADLQLKAIKIVADHGDRFKSQLTMIGGPQ